MGAGRAFLRDGRHYDALHAGLVADIPFWVDEARHSGRSVLEVGCGTGRIAIPVAKAVPHVVGLDVADSMLARAREKAAAAGADVEWVHADCRSFHLGRSFDLVFVAFNTMALLHERGDLESFLGCVREHLAAGGRFVADVFNPSIEVLSGAPDEWRPAFRYADPDGAGEVVIEERARYDDASQVRDSTWRYTRRGETLSTERLALRCLFPQELDALLHYNGLQLVAKLGDYDRRPFAPGSPRQIAICERQGTGSLGLW